MDTQRVDAVLQLALAAAAQEDDWKERELGPIHLVKYVYLADLAYARLHAGELFSGATWTFHNFGPWDAQVHERIEPALAAIGATKTQLPSRYETDFVRYRLEQDTSELLTKLEASLPGELFGAVRRAVREFGRDTETLLRQVYLTSPMLTAEPGERLEFGQVPQPEPRGRPDAHDHQKAASGGKRAARARKAAAARLRTQVRRRLEETGRPRRPAPIDPAPRYDDVFFDGVAWLGESAPRDRLKAKAVRVRSAMISRSDSAIAAIAGRRGGRRPRSCQWPRSD